MSVDNTNVDDTTQNTETTENTDDTQEQSYDEVKAAAEALEAENKTLKASAEEGDKLSNAQRRLEKATAKNEALKNPETTQSDELSADDVYTLRDKGYALDSDEAKALLELKALPRNADKTLAQVAETPAGKAELEAIKADSEAKDIVDENADSEALLATKNEIKERFTKGDEVPQDPAQFNDLKKGLLDDFGL